VKSFLDNPKMNRSVTPVFLFESAKREANKSVEFSAFVQKVI